MLHEISPFGVEQAPNLCFKQSQSRLRKLLRWFQTNQKLFNPDTPAEKTKHLRSLTPCWNQLQKLSNKLALLLYCCMPTHVADPVGNVAHVQQETPSRPPKKQEPTPSHQLSSSACTVGRYCDYTRRLALCPLCSYKADRIHVQVLAAPNLNPKSLSSQCIHPHWFSPFMVHILVALSVN